MTVAALLGIMLAAAPLWHEPSAGWRVRLEWKQPEKTVAKVPKAVFKPSDWLLPEYAAGRFAAYGADGSKVAWQLSPCERAVILTPPPDGGALWLYGGSRMPTRTAGGKAGEEDGLLTLSGMNWNLPGNFTIYQNNRRRDFRRSNRWSYDNMAKQFNSLTFNSLSRPAVTGAPGQLRSWWDVQNAFINRYFDGRRYNLWQSRALLRNQEWKFFHREPMRVFLPDRRYYVNRIYGETDGFFRNSDRWRKEWDKVVKSDPEKAIFDPFVDKYDEQYKRRGNLALNPSWVRVVTKEMDLGAQSALCFAGKFFAPARGRYEFAVETESLWVMRIDEKNCARKMFTPGKDSTPEHRFSVELTYGVHDFKLFYLRCESLRDFAVRIRPPGGEWQLLNDSFFAPAPEWQVAALEFPDGKSAPPVTRRELGAVFGGKMRRIPLCRLDAPGGVLRCDGIDAATPLHVLADGRNNFAVNGVTWRAGALRAPDLPLMLRHALRTTLFAPQVIYADEPWRVERVWENSFPVKLDVLLDMTGEIVAVPPGITRSMLKVDDTGGGMALPRKLEFTSRIVGGEKEYFSATAFAPHQLPEGMTVRGRSLLTQSGGELTLVIPRPGLARQRRWELPRIFWRGIPDRVLIIGAPEQIGATEMQKYFQNDKLETQCFLWPEPQVNGDARILRAMAGSWGALGKIAAECDVFVLSVPESDIRLLGDDLLCRYLAVWVEYLRTKGRGGRICLVLPQESTADKRHAPYIGEWRHMLRKFARSYGLEIMP